MKMRYIKYFLCIIIKILKKNYILKKKNGPMVNNEYNKKNLKKKKRSMNIFNKLKLIVNFILINIL